MKDGDTKDGYTLIICKKCGVNRFVDSRLYKDGLPETCIACGKR